MSDIKSNQDKKPPALRVIPENIPAFLRERAKWVGWRWEWRDDRWTKPPICIANGGAASSTEAATWATFDAACAAYQSKQYHLDGIGFAVEPSDDLVGVDLDDVLDPDSGEIFWNADAEVMALDSYAERSPSGTGYRVFCMGSLPPKGRRRGKYEIYNSGRYLTCTGHHLPASPAAIEPRQREIDTFHARVFAEQLAKSKSGASRGQSVPVDLDDTQLLDKARNAKNGPAFRALYDSGSASGHGDNRSSADLALCNHLAYWTQCDEGRMDRLFRSSALMRDKWDRPDYSSRTMELAISDCKSVYEPRQSSPSGPPPLRLVNSSAELAPAPMNTPDAEAWEDPIPFTESELPAFPIMALPPVLRVLAEEVAASVQIPVDLPGMTGIGMLAAATRGRVQIQIGQTHSQRTNLYVVPIAKPSSRKSEVMEIYQRPIVEAQHAARLKAEGEIKVLKAEFDAANERVRFLKTEAAKTRDQAKRSDLMAEMAEIADQMQEPPAVPQLICDDVTPESLAMLMAEQCDNSMAILSPEGGFFDTLAGRYSKTATANLDLVLKAFNAEMCTVNRVGRSPLYLPSPRITMTLMVQPKVVQDMAEHKAFRSKGFLSRMLYCFPAGIDNSEYQNRPIDNVARLKYDDLIKEIIAIPNPASKENPRGVHTLTMDAAALELWTEQYNAIQKRKAEGGDLAEYDDWAGKLPSQAARIAALFHLAEHRNIYTATETPITAQTMLAAWCVVEYLIPHALKTFGEMLTSDERRMATKILAWVKRKDLHEFAFRDCWRGFQNVSTTEEVERALSSLCDRQYLKQGEVAQKAMVGRPPAPRYFANPALFDK